MELIIRQLWHYLYGHGERRVAFYETLERCRCTCGADLKMGASTDGGILLHYRRRLWHYLFGHTVDRDTQVSFVCTCGVTLKALFLFPNKSYVGVGIRLWWRLGNWWRGYNPWQLLREVQWFLQRGRRGYADCDYSDMNDYLARVILGLLTQMRKEGHSYPMEMELEEWDERLDEIIEGFKKIANDEDGWGANPAVTRALLSFALVFPDLWD